MIIWLNGAFGAGKTQTAYELHRRLPGSYVYDPENAGFFMRASGVSTYYSNTTTAEYPEKPAPRPPHQRLPGLPPVAALQSGDAALYGGAL